MNWVCKQCGRSMRSEEKPNHCYFCRIDHLENVSDEDAVKMGVTEGTQIHLHPDQKPCQVEFEGDVEWDPWTGEKVMIIGSNVAEGNVHKHTLRQFQRDIMERVFE